MQRGVGRQVLLGAVVVSMLVLFLLPPSMFVSATFVATSVMIAGAYFEGVLGKPPRRWVIPLMIGVGSAAALYLVFLIGAATINELHPFGITGDSEKSIYALIVSPSIPFAVQVSVLLFDSAGYEAYFRGGILKTLRPRLGILAAPAVGLLDASIHLATLYQYPGVALLWFGTTLIADTFWGLTYYYSRSLLSSFASHFIWDLAIFVVLPIV